MSEEENAVETEADAGGEPVAEDTANSQENYPPADLENLTPSTNGATSTGETEVNLDVILDVPVTISVEIGWTQISIRQLLQYTQGSVIELDRHVGEPLDVLVNNTLIAHGEVVMIDDQFGIRLTDVVSPSERVKKLQ